MSKIEDTLSPSEDGVLTKRFFDLRKENQKDDVLDSGRLDRIEEKADDLSRKLGMIFGSNVLINGKWINWIGVSLL